MINSMLRGAAAGAAGVTVLNAATYLDMAIRGRPPSSTPEKTIERMLQLAGITVPGDDKTRPNRLSGLGALMGLLTGVAVGAGYGGARALGWRPPLPLGSAASTATRNGGFLRADDLHGNHRSPEMERGRLDE
jgi:hypothetical protein